MEPEVIKSAPTRPMVRTRSCLVLHYRYTSSLVRRGTVVVGPIRLVRLLRISCIMHPAPATRCAVPGGDVGRRGGADACRW